MTVLEGYAAVFGAISNPIRSGTKQFRERIMRGAFAASIRAGAVRAQFMHVDGNELASQSSGTLQLHEDAHGVRVRIDLRDRFPWIPEGVRTGRYQGMSFRFTVPANGETWSSSGAELVRTVHLATLHEVSVVTTPAYLQTSIRVAAPSADAMHLMRMRLELAERLAQVA